MDNQKRLLLAIGLSLGLTLVYSKLVWEPQATKEREAAEAVAMRADAGTPVAAAPAAGDGGSPVAVVAPQPAEAVPSRSDLPKRELSFDRTTARYTFSTEGAG